MGPDPSKSHLDLAGFSLRVPLLQPLVNLLPVPPPSSEPVLASSPPGRAQLSSCSEPQVSQFIRKHVTSCLLVSDTSTELSYILPSEAAKKGAFERLFQVWGQGPGCGGGGHSPALHVHLHWPHLAPS
jgi:hypothetical protein